MIAYEQQRWQQGFARVAGVDEVGRGPWAGPVVAAAVILDPNQLPTGVRDSKKLSAKKRAALYEVIMATADVSIAEASVAEIDSLNIRAATHLAMQRAIAGLKQQPDFAVIDGNALPDTLPCPAEAVVKGDDQVLSIACASVVAKVYRDRLMAELAQDYPEYGWEKNAGYGTKVHQLGLAKYGVSPHHRTSFRPIRELL